jgi:SAM-dependent methyltransferase
VSGGSADAGILRNLARQLRKALVSPEEILPFFLGKLRVRRVQRDGKEFYEYRGKPYPLHLNEGNAQSHIRDTALRYCQGRGIDIGASEWPFPGAEAIQQDRKRNALHLDDIPESSLDFAFSSHCLEHIVNWQTALELWISKLKPGGVLFLYLPHEDMELWHPGAPWAGPSHKWIPTWQVLVPFLEARGMKELDVERGRDAYWSFHIAARRGGPEDPAAKP